MQTKYLTGSVKGIPVNGPEAGIIVLKAVNH